MTTGINNQPALAKSVLFTDDELVVMLVDGHSITAPITRFTKLSTASSYELIKWEKLGDGEIVHWPLLDENISVGQLHVEYGISKRFINTNQMSTCTFNRYNVHITL